MKTQTLADAFCETKFWELRAQGLYMKDIAKQFGMSSSSLTRIMKKRNMPLEKGSTSFKISTAYERLEKEGLNDSEIASHIGISEDHLIRKMREVRQKNCEFVLTNIRTAPIDPLYVKKLFEEDQFDFRQVCLILRVPRQTLKAYLKEHGLPYNES